VWSAFNEEQDANIIEEAKITQVETASAKPDLLVKEKRPTWKYLVERTIEEYDHVKKKKKVNKTRAFVFFGAEAKKARGQRERSPQVVYIDKDGNRLPDRQAPTAHPFNPFPVEKLAMTSKFPKNYGESQQKPLPVSSLSEIIEIFPIDPNRPEKKIAPGLSWSPTVYFTFFGPESMFQPNIEHKVTGYRKIMGRKCAVIEYSITGAKTIEPPDLYENARFKYGLEGHGTAYFDPIEDIIVQKSQTIRWTTQSEKFDQRDDGKIGLVVKHDVEKTVNLSVSLLPDEQGVGGSRVIVYLLIATSVVIVIAGLILLLKKKASSRGKSCAT